MDIDVLERAIINVNIEILIHHWDKMDRELYRLILLANIDHLWVKMDDKLFSHLSNVFITHEYVEVYNRIFLMHRFVISIKRKDYETIKELYVNLLREGIAESILINILSNNLNDLLETPTLQLCSLMATYFCNSPYREDYEKVCHVISDILNGVRGGDQKG